MRKKGTLVQILYVLLKTDSKSKLLSPSMSLLVCGSHIAQAYTR